MRRAISRSSRLTVTVGVVAVGLVASVLSPSTAVAVDGQRLRTPVLWSDDPCMQVFDRSADPVLNIPYGIPFEDIDVTDDEVADGRRHQFFAMCRDHGPDEELPIWISEADVAAAEALELVDLGTVTGDQILDLDPAWTGCASRVNADADRRPITFAMAEAGIDWDTAGLDVGAYVIQGFTHDPAFSQWWPRPGVIKVVDDPDLAASPPAAAVLNGEEVVEITEPVTIEGCVSAMEGSTLTASWAQVGAGDAWQPFLEDEPVAGESFAIDMLLSPRMAGQSVRVRVEVADPMGRAYTAFMHERVITLPGQGPGDSGCVPQDGCDTTSGGSGTGDTGALDGTGSNAGSGGSGGSGAGTDAGATGASSPAADGGAAEGCGCRTRPRSGADAAWLLLLLAAVRRRRG
ncbi:MAG: hypothetical protein K0V04_39660 [Deltaproteobacteria bacterium]|nr:hypothetical protein [Deltaproteobacteria bacterium]